ncbi:MAG: hypothetical protein QOJ02_441 [Acidobacteriota bacterium]|jgi:hypothetical protein|nr:hypothetical protein [Acidobacteriota bacterium]
MIQVTTYSLILIGLYLRYLRAAPTKSRKEIGDEIEQFQSLIANPALNFSVSLQALQSLLDFKAKIMESEETSLSTTESSELTELMGDFEKVLFAEAQTKYLYLLSERRYNTKFLLEHPSRLFAEGVGKDLPRISKIDFIEGFKCLVFGQATAAAFHILRATEGVLKEYYLKNIKRNREKKPMWGNMVIGLRAKTRNKPPVILLDSLDMIRRSYRNPTNHPEAVYTLEEAQDLLGVCIDVVNKMALSMKATA